MLTLVADVAPLDRVMTELITSAKRDLRVAFDALDMSDPEATRDALIEVYGPLVESYGDASGAAAAEWYEVYRAEQGIPGDFVAEVPEWFIREKVDSTARWAAGQLWGDDPASVLSVLEGALIRDLEDANRAAVTSNSMLDEAASGWHRIARPDGCDFCVMLTGRGAVYRRETSDFASHDNCRCSAAPSFDPSAPEVSVREYEASKRMGDVRRRASDPSLSAADRAVAQGILDDHRARVKGYIESDPDRIDAIRVELV